MIYKEINKLTILTELRLGICSDYFSTSIVALEQQYIKGVCKVVELPLCQLLLSPKFLRHRCFHCFLKSIRGFDILFYHIYPFKALRLATGLKQKLPVVTLYVN